MFTIGIDIGGTKCAVSLGNHENNQLTIIKKVKFPTPVDNPELAMELFEQHIKELSKGYDVKAIGISCGSPLDSKKGIIQAPPHLPDWKNVKIVKRLKLKFGLPVGIMNDANACALAENRYGAGVGSDNMVFLTCGTGFGSGIIANGKVLNGACDNAGEIGHVSLSKSGPWGYGKKGSAEGYVSGGGIASLARIKVANATKYGVVPEMLKRAGDISAIDTKLVFECYRDGDEIAVKLIKEVSKKLGEAIAIIIDLLNPDTIIIGGYYMRQHEILFPYITKTIKKLVLKPNYKICKILPAKLDEEIGDFASHCIAKELL